MFLCIFWYWLENKGKFPWGRGKFFLCGYTLIPSHQKRCLEELYLVVLHCASLIKDHFSVSTVGVGSSFMSKHQWLAVVPDSFDVACVYPVSILVNLLRHQRWSDLHKPPKGPVHKSWLWDMLLWTAFTIVMPPIVSMSGCMDGTFD